MVQLLISDCQKTSNSVHRRISYCDTRRLVNSIQAIPKAQTSSDADFSSKQSFIDQKLRRSCNTFRNPCNPHYTPSSSQRIQSLRHNILKRETRRDFNGRLIN